MMSKVSKVLVEMLAWLGLPTPGYGIVEDAGGEQLLGRVAAARLGWELKRALKSKQEKYYTVESLMRKVGDTPAENLAFVLLELVDLGLLERFFRFESPESHGGLKDYSSYEEIPFDKEVEDATTGKPVEVTTENMRVVFHPVRSAA